MPNTLLLVDAYSLIYRAFYAIRSLTGPQGQPVNAIYGFTKMLRKLGADYRPTHAAVVFDLGAPKQRLELLPSYKAQRPPTPPDLDAQLPTIREVLAAMRLPVVELDGEEADDIIATLAVRAADEGSHVLIASNDKDFMQIVGPNIQLIRPDSKETQLIDPAGVEARYGVKPEQIVDLLSLTGDSADNVPGIPGVGEKTAAELLRTYHDIDNLLAHATELPKPKLRDALLSRADQLRRNRSLIALRTSLDLPIQLDTLKVQPYDRAKLTALVRQLGFKSLLAELEKDANGNPPDLFGAR
jgi:DNA polymerase-1